MATIYMNLTLPTPSVTIGPQWATELNAALTVVDEHDHSSGKGVQIRTNGLNIDNDLSFNDNAAIDILKLQFDEQSSTLTGASNLNSVYSVNGDLYFTNGSGTAVQITSGTELAPPPINLNTYETLSVSTNLVISPTDTVAFLSVDTSASRTIELPTASAVDTGRFYIIKDVTGDALNNPITIEQASGSGDLIDGSASVTVNSNYGSVSVIKTGLNAWSIY